MDKRKLWLLVGIFVGIAFINVSSAIAGNKIVLKHASYWPVDTPHEQMMHWWCNEIEKRTSGQVKFIHYQSGSLLKVTDLLRGTASGMADVSCICPGYIPSNVPLATLWDIPFMQTSAWVHAKVLHELMHTFPPIKEEWAANGVKLLYIGPSSGGGLFTRKKQIKTLEDLEGLKLRTYGYVSKAINRLGGVSVSLPVAEMYTGIQRGTVDGAMFWLAASKDFKMHEIVKYVTFNTGLDGCTSACAFMNTNVWKSLPGNVKKVIEDIDDELPEAMTKIWFDAEKRGIEFMKQQKMVLYSLPDKEKKRWIEKVKVNDLHREWAENIESKYGSPAKEYLKRANGLLKKYRPLDTVYKIPGTY